MQMFSKLPARPGQTLGQMDISRGHLGGWERVKMRKDVSGERINASSRGSIVPWSSSLEEEKAPKRTELNVS